MTVDADQRPSGKPNRGPFFLVLALFFAPLLAAFAVYYGSGWRPAGSTNKGELMTPAVALPAVTLSNASGPVTDANLLRKVWNLVYVGDGQCDAMCLQALSSTRVVRQLLGKDMPRTGRILLYTGQLSAELPSAQPDLLMANLDDAAGQTLINAWPRRNGQSVLQSPRIYLVDPLGNLMMSYAPTVDPRDMYQDLKKLLKLSHIG